MKRRSEGKQSCLQISDVIPIGRGFDDHRPCLVSLSQEGSYESCITYAQARRAINQHKQWLRGSLETAFSSYDPFSVDTVIAYVSSNSAGFFFSSLACTDLTCATLVPALLNTRWSPEEMFHAIQPNGTNIANCCTLILYGPSFRQKALQVVARLEAQGCQAIAKSIPEFSTAQFTKETNLVTKKGLSKIGSQSESILSQSRQMDHSCHQNNNTNDAIILFTSGTTSGAKGVRLSHQALLLQAYAKTTPPCQYTNDTRMLASTLPFFHVGGLTSILAVWMAHGTVLLPRKAQNGFNPSFVMKSLGMLDWNCNTLVVVPAMLHSLLKHLPSNTSHPQVKLILIGGQSAPPSVLKSLRLHFPCARIVQTYACTEAASSLTFLDLTKDADSEQVGRKIPIAGDCVGTPPSHIYLALITTQRGKRKQIQNAFEIGLIASRGSHLMNGYWRRSRPSFPAIDKQDWFISNDLGFWDRKGRLYFSGRASDTIRTGGETVLALEVERVLLQHPLIDEVAVFPLADDRFGEIVATAVVTIGTQTVTLAAIKDWCKSHGLAGYKCPKKVFVFDVLPKNSSGKVVKAILKEMFRQAEKQELRSKL